MRFPALNPRNWADLVQNFQALQSWLLKTGDRAHGVVTVHTAAAVSGTATVAHGLGRLPTAARADVVEAGANANATPVSFTATNLTVAVRYVDGVARTQDNTVYWEVIA
jgi:hypothetical protein